MTLTRKELAAMIDHSLLRPNATLEELKKFCEESIEYGFKAVCVVFVGLGHVSLYLYPTIPAGLRRRLESRGIAGHG